MPHPIRNAVLAVVSIAAVSAALLPLTGAATASGDEIVIDAAPITTPYGSGVVVGAAFSTTDGSELPAGEVRFTYVDPMGDSHTIKSTMPDGRTSTMIYGSAPISREVLFPASDGPRTYDVTISYAGATATQQVTIEPADVITTISLSKKTLSAADNRKTAIRVTADFDAPGVTNSMLYGSKATLYVHGKPYKSVTVTGVKRSSGSVRAAALFDLKNLPRGTTTVWVVFASDSARVDDGTSTRRTIKIL